MAAFSMKSLFGPTLKTKTGVVETATALAGKTVGIYFSAHWCGPCRGFTPQLAAKYKSLTGAGKPFEIVFVSSDKDDASFNSYHDEQPWLALPYAERNLKDTLSSKYGVRGIPSLVIVGEDGQTITKNGRQAVMSDTDGSAFPWTPPTVKQMLGDTLATPTGTVSLSDAFAGKENICLYFSAHWCPPCRGFTPEFVKFYNKHANNKNFEVVFVSSDKDEGQFDEYRGEMPWLSLPYSNRSGKDQLSDEYDVEGIPTLVVLDKDLNVITKSARGNVSADPEGADFPWHPKPMTDFSEGAESNGFDINSKPALCLMMENEDDDGQAALCAIMLQVAEDAKEAGKGKDEGPEFIVFTGKQAGGIGDKVRELTQTTKLRDDPLLIMLDIPDKGGFYVSKATEFESKADIVAFLDQWRSKSIDRQQLG